MSKPYDDTHVRTKEEEAFSKRIQVRLHELQRRLESKLDGTQLDLHPVVDRRQEFEGATYNHDELRMEAMETACAECGDNSKSALFPCTGCNQVHYCGIRCQEKAWHRIHKHVCKKHQLGYPTMEKLRKADFHELAVFMDEWRGCGTWLVSGVQDVVTSSLDRGNYMFLRAEPADIAYMGRTISQQLESTRLARKAQLRTKNADEVGFWNLIFLAYIVASNCDYQGRKILQSTELLPILANCFCDFANEIATCELQVGGGQAKTVELVKKCLETMTLLLSGANQRYTVSLQECANLAVGAIADCVVAIESVPDLRSTTFEKAPRQEKVAMACQKAYVAEIEKQELRKELRRLLRKLTYRSFAPNNIKQVAITFKMDIDLCSPESTVEALQTWATVTSNISTRCQLDTTELKNAVRTTAARRLQLQLRFADE